MKQTTICAILTILAVAGLFTTVSCAKKKTVTTAASTVAQPPQAVPQEPEAEPAPPEPEETADMIEEAKGKERQAAVASEERKQFLTRHIHFAFDSAQLDEAGQGMAREKALWLAENQGVAVEIQGHCDQAGTDAYNMALGNRRALSVKSYLQSLGILEDRMQVKSLGETEPISMAPGDEAAQLNRRVQFKILSPAQ